MRLCALLTPSRDGRAHLDHSESVTNVRLLASRHGVRIKRYVGKGSSNLPRNRNLLAAQALKDGCDTLFWIDCDIGFDPEDFFRLINSDCDVVGAIPQARTHQYNEPARFAGVGIEREPDDTGFHQALAVPTAFMMVRAYVFSNLAEQGKAQSFKAKDAPTELNDILHNWFFYQLRPSATQDGELEDDAEDYYFCRKWRETGETVHAAPDVRLRHHEGLVCHSLTIRELWNAQARQAAA